MQFHSNSRFAGSSLFLLAAAGLFLSSARAQDADLSTPKKAGAAFVKAMQGGDMQTMRKVATGPEENFTAIKSYCDLFGAIKRYEAAAIKRFGDKGKLPAGAFPDLSAALDNAEEKIDGEAATLSNPGQKSPIKLKKEGKNWKVDLKEMDPDMMRKSPKVREAADAIDGLVKNIEAGKYETPDEALMALGRVMYSLNKE